MKIRKLMSLALTGAMALSIGTAAFATGPNREITISGGYVAPVIAVSVPSNGGIAINPYAINYKFPGSNATIKNQQILTKPMVIKNNSEMDLNVGAKVATTIPTSPASGVKLVPSEEMIDGNGKPDTDPDYIPPATGKSVFMVLQMDANSAYGVKHDTTTADTEAMYATWSSYDFHYDANKDIVLNATREASSSNMAVLKAGTYTGTPDTYQCTNGGAAFVRLAGKTVADPNEAWTTNDSVTAKITFTFKPAVNVVAVDATSLSGLTTTPKTVHAFLTGSLTGGTYAWTSTKKTGTGTATALDIGSANAATTTVAKPANAAKGDVYELQLVWTPTGGTSAEAQTIKIPVTIG